jgi:hypothetical protein
VGATRQTRSTRYLACQRPDGSFRVLPHELLDPATVPTVGRRGTKWQHEVARMWHDGSLARGEGTSKSLRNLADQVFNWSGRRDSNPRPSPWQLEQTSPFICANTHRPSSDCLSRMRPSSQLQTISRGLGTRWARKPTTSSGRIRPLKCDGPQAVSGGNQSRGRGSARAARGVSGSSLLGTSRVCRRGTGAAGPRLPGRVTSPVGIGCFV